MASNPGAAISSQSCSLMGEIKGQIFHDKATKKQSNQSKSLWHKMLIQTRAWKKQRLHESNKIWIYVWRRKSCGRVAVRRLFLKAWRIIQMFLYRFTLLL